MRCSSADIFFKQKRFDLIFKYLYLKYPNNSFVKSAYLESIRAFNNFYEKAEDGTLKLSPDDFTKSFDDLYYSIKKNGYNQDLGKIPVGNNGEIQNGAHRLAICTFLNYEIKTIPDTLTRTPWNYDYFKKNKMKQEIMDFGAEEYVKLNPHSHIVSIHPNIHIEEDNNIIEILQKYGFIYYEKNIKIDDKSFNKIAYLFEKNTFIQNIKNKFIKTNRTISENLRTFIFVCNNNSKKTEAINEIKNIYTLNVHISNKRREAVKLAKLYFGKNSVFTVNK